MRYLIASDIHLKPESSETVGKVLSAITDLITERSVDDVVLLGDVYHVRYRVPIRLQNQLWDWLTDVTEMGVRVHILPGNHDQDDVSGRNALEVFQGPDVDVYTEPTRNGHGLWLPYRKDVDELVALALEGPEDFPAVAWLHHGIVGAMMNDHVVAGELDGINPDVFAAFDVVFAGHWHRHQEVGPVVYVGSPWQTRADEAGQAKGVVLFDEDGWEFVEIPGTPRHHRVRVLAGGSAPHVATGDTVHVVLDDPDDSARVASEIREAGAIPHVAPPELTFNEARLGLRSSDSPLEAARAYARENAGDLDVDGLLSTLESLV